MQNRCIVALAVILYLSLRFSSGVYGDALHPVPSALLVVNDAGTVLTSYHTAISAVLVLPDGSVLTGGDDSENPTNESGEDASRSANGDPVDGTYLRLCTLDGAVTHIHIDNKSFGALYGLYLSKDGRTIYAGWTESMCIIDAATWHVRIVNGFFPDSMSGVETLMNISEHSLPSAGMRAIVRGDADNSVSARDYDASLQLIKTRVIAQTHLRQGSSGLILNLSTCSPDGFVLASYYQAIGWQSSGEHMSLILWDTRTGQKLRRLTLPDSPHNSRAVSNIDAMQFSPDGRILVAHDDLSRITLWDVVTGRIVGQISGVAAYDVKSTARDAPPYVSGGPLLMAVTPDDRYVAFYCPDGTIGLYSLRTFLSVVQFRKCPLNMQSLQFSPDSKTLFGTVGQSFSSEPYDYGLNDLRCWKIPANLEQLH